MKLSTTILTAALVFTGLAAIAPAVGAIDTGCVRANMSGVANVVAVPGALFLNWSPECVVIPNGGTVMWTNLDAAPLEAHGAKSSVPGCFDLGRITLPGMSQSIKLDFADGILFTEERAQGAALATPGVCDTSFTTEGEGTIVLSYDCVLHGAPMTSIIRIEV